MIKEKTDLFCPQYLLKKSKSYQSLNAGHAILSGIAKKSAKGDDGCQVGEIEENNRRDALHGQAVPKNGLY